MITYYMRHAARASCSSVRCSSGTHPLHQMSGPIRVVDAIIVNFTFYPPYSRRILVAPKGHYCCCCVALLVHLRCVKMFPGIANYTRRPKRASLLLLCCVAGTPQVLQNIPGNRIIMNKRLKHHHHFLKCEEGFSLKILHLLRILNIYVRIYDRIYVYEMRVRAWYFVDLRLNVYEG